MHPPVGTQRKTHCCRVHFAYLEFNCRHYAGAKSERFLQSVELEAEDESKSVN